EPLNAFRIKLEAKNSGRHPLANRSGMRSTKGNQPGLRIGVGVQRMERQRRLAPEDLATARRNLVKLLDLLKKEAVFLGNPNTLNNASFQAARKRLRRRLS